MENAEPKTVAGDLQGPESVRPPFFVMGCEASGTNLLSLILDSHSEIAVCRGSHYYLHFGPNQRFYGDLQKAHNMRRLVRDFDEILHLHEVDSAGPDAILAALRTRDFEEVLRVHLQLYVKRKGKRLAGERSSQHYLHLARILEKFPDSPVVFTLRDPRDLALAHREGFGFSVDEAIQSWNNAYSAFCKASRGIHLVCYEDLVRSPESTLEAVCSYLGVKFEPQMLKFYEHTPKRSYPAAHHRHLFSPLNSEAIGEFIRMSKEDIALVEASCAAGMKALGYERVAPDIESRTVTRVVRHGVGGRVLHRLRYYGWDIRRWKRGLRHWRIAARVRARYALKLGFLRPNL